MPASSAYTSTRQIPAAFKKFENYPIFSNGINLDWGGGKYDDASKYLLTQLNCTNLIYDPFNRSTDHNNNVMEIVAQGHLTSITCLNVLNVIQDPIERNQLIQDIKQQTCYNPKIKAVLFQIYEGNKSNIPSSGKTTQNNKPTKEYLKEIQAHFSNDSWHTTTKQNTITVNKR